MATVFDIRHANNRPYITSECAQIEKIYCLNRRTIFPQLLHSMLFVLHRNFQVYFWTPHRFHLLVCSLRIH